MVYGGPYFEVGGAAELPTNSITGRHLGGMAIVDLFIGNVVPAFGCMVAR